MSGIRGASWVTSVGFMTPGTVRAGWPVAAQTLKAGAATANWLLARGVPLIVDGGHRWPGTGSLVTRVLNYRYQVDAVHHTLAATIVISAGGLIPITINGVSYIVSELPSILHIPFPNLVADGEISAQFTFTWTVDVPLMVHSLSLYECPTIAIEESGTTPMEPHSPVLDGWDERESISGLARAVEDLRATYYRRGTMFNWAIGLPDGYNTDQTSFQTFYDAFKPAIQTRLMYNGETQRDAKVNVYARVDGGSTGEVKIEMHDGTFVRDVTFTVTATSDTWHTTQTIAVNADLPGRWDSDGGIRGAHRDEVQIYARVTGSSQRVYVLAVAIWDPPG